MNKSYTNTFRVILLIGLFFLIALQTSSAIDLRYHWASSIITLATISLVVWKFKPQLHSKLLAIGFLLLILILLVNTWKFGISTWNFIAGILPTSDAGGYYFDAQRILAGNPISDFSSRRPLFAAFLAGALAISGNDLQLALIYISIFQGAALAICLGLFPKSIPRIVVVVFVITIFLYYRRFVGTTLTEQLGLAYGMMAFGLLLRGFWSNTKWIIAIGIFVLSLALNARAGPFLILITIIFLAARINATRTGLVSLRTMLELLAVAALGFFVNQLLLGILHGDRSASFSNFSHTLYGLVYGGDWTLAFKQHPELESLSTKEQPTAIMNLALQHIFEDPSSLLKGSIKAWAIFIPTVYIFAASSHPFAPALIPYFFLSVFALAGLIWLIRNLALPVARMLFVALVGILISVPFVPPWDSDQMRAYAAVMPFIAFLPAVGAMSFNFKSAADPLTDEFKTEKSNVKWWCMASILLIGIVSAILPAWAYGRFPASKHNSLMPQCSVGEFFINAEVLPGTLRKVTNNDNSTDLKSVGKRFLVDPVGGLREVPKLFLYASLTKEALEKNAFAEFAPDYVRNFVQGVREGESVAFVRMNESTGEISSLKLVFINESDAKIDQNTNIFCATELPKLDALRLNIKN